jgi:hypothetical protein
MSIKGPVFVERSVPAKRLTSPNQLESGPGAKVAVAVSVAVSVTGAARLEARKSWM